MIEDKATIGQFEALVSAIGEIGGFTTIKEYIKAKIGFFYSL